MERDKNHLKPLEKPKALERPKPLEKPRPAEMPKPLNPPLDPEEMRKRARNRQRKKEDKPHE